MTLDQGHPANRQVLAALAAAAPGAPPLAPASDVPDAYLSRGCHPDVVERVWDVLGAALGPEARALVYGRPVLVAPASGVVVAVCIGTSYAVRVPSALRADATAAGASPIHQWSSGRRSDLREDFGPDWVFGFWNPLETAWVKAGQ